MLTLTLQVITFRTVNSETNMIKKNVGRIDQILRIISSSVMLYYGFFEETAISSGLSGTLLGIFGTGIFLSAVFQYCPLYAVTGINTCEKEDNNKNYS